MPPKKMKKAAGPGDFGMEMPPPMSKGAPAAEQPPPPPPPPPGKEARKKAVFGDGPTPPPPPAAKAAPAAAAAGKKKKKGKSKADASPAYAAKKSGGGGGGYGGNSSEPEDEPLGGGYSYNSEGGLYEAVGPQAYDSEDQNSLYSPETEAGSPPTPPPPPPPPAQQQYSKLLSRLASGNQVPLNSATCVSIGAGNTGKTTTRKSLLGLEFDAVRKSTVGGEQVQLTVSAKGGAVSMGGSGGGGKGAAGGFHEADTDVSQVERALVLAAVLEQQRRAGGKVDKGAAEAALADLDPAAAAALANISAEQLAELVQSDQAHDGMGALLGRLSAKEGEVATQALGPDEDRARARAEAAAARKAAKEAKSKGAGAGSSTKRRASTKQGSPAKPKTADRTAIQLDAEMVMRLDSKQKSGELEGVHVRLWDCGGQAQFINLVVQFIQEHAICTVFFRMDELLANVRENKTVVGDSSLSGMTELFHWLDAIAARSKDGPVLLAGTRADEVTSSKDQRLISDAIHKRLRAVEHPLRERLVRPKSGKLLYFAIDNTKSIADPGVQQYRDALQACVAESPSAKLQVPLPLLQFYDAVIRATGPPSAKDSPALLRLRAAHGGQQVPFCQLAELAWLYEECSGRSLDGDLDDAEFRDYLDLLVMLGVCLHSNAPALDSLVVVNPMWLLEQNCRIIREPSLHPLPLDDMLPLVPFDNLYRRGVLEASMIKALWSHHPDTMQVQMLGLALRTRLFIPMETAGQTAFVVPSLLPETPPDFDRATAIPGSLPPVEILLVPFTGTPFMQYAFTEAATLASRCRTPAGLFEQLLAGVVKLNQSSSASSAASSSFEPILSRVYGLLRLGRYVVELEQVPALNSIRIRLFVRNASGLVQQFIRIVNDIIATAFVTLNYELLTPVSDTLFVRVSALQNFSRTSEPSFVIQRQTFTRGEVLARFQALLPYQLSEHTLFHCFVSYRHGRDSDHTAAFVNALSALPLGSEGEHVFAFFDRLSLPSGQAFDVSFMRGIVNSYVFTPFVTAYALERMCGADSLQHLDHLLLEWWLALTLHNMDSQMVYAILPIFSGKITEDEDGREKVEDLFATFSLEQLPDEVNEPTWKRLQQFLRENMGLEDVEPPRLTVREIVASMWKFNAPYTRCWDLAVTSAHGGGSSSAAPTGESKLDEAVGLANSIQRVFAACAQAVKDEVESVLSTHGKQHSSGQPLARDSSAGGAPNLDARELIKIELERWSVEAVQAWVLSTPAASFAPIFAAKNVNGFGLKILTAASLKKEFGIGHALRRDFLRARDRLMALVPPFRMPESGSSDLAKGFADIAREDSSTSKQSGRAADLLCGAGRAPANACVWE